MSARPLLLLLLPLAYCCCCCCCCSLGSADPGFWPAQLASLLQDCPQALGGLANCARRRALAAIDRILDDDRVPLVDGLQLVRYNASSSRPSAANSTLAIRELLKRIREGDEGRQEEADWRGKLIKRLARVLKTHVIKLDVQRLRWAASSPGQSEARGRRRRRRQMQMMPIIMMGVLLMGSVLIPMGFQFLAVLGGKALILAKMALMLSSIQGLKKIATNGVNYGLYHTPVPEPWHERSTAGLELPPSYSLSYAAGYNQHAPAAPLSSGYLDPATLPYLANRRSAVAADT